MNAVASRSSVWIVVTAIVDRLTFGGNIIETGSDSYRLAHAKAALQHNSA